MRIVDISDAKSNLSCLIDEAANGDPFIVARDGTPLVKVVPLDPPRESRRFGFMTGDFQVPDDFDRMCQDEIIALFEGEE